MNYSNRMEIFHKLTFDELTHAINKNIFKGLLESQYDDFVRLCEYIEPKKDQILDISIFLVENTIHFEISYKDGTSETK